MATITHLKWGRAQNGQALAEFALISVVLALLVGGAVEFGFLLGHKVELASASRAGARWAATHPTAWTAALSPASSSIQGQVVYAGGTQQLPNDDAHVTVEYFAVSGSTLTPCGRWSAAQTRWVAQNGYSQSGCVTDGNLVRVTLKNSYPLLTAALGRGIGPTVTVQTSAAMVMFG